MSATVYQLPVRRDGDWNDQRRPSGRGGVRLTRRGRVVVFAFTLVVLLVIALIGARVASAAQLGAEKSPAATTHTVVVGTGETLWAYASRASAHSDLSVREMELRIKELNGLDTSELYAGQTLIIPN
ncbi:MAG: LysM peptidoglycan-binding domain-containing protein [Nocardioides sp.]|nr:LysM peptidoglycan-binding domain-containing protein [Nocardioides sp.]